MIKRGYKLLISGYKGYIGSYFCKYLRQKNIQFAKFDFKKYPKKIYQFTHFFHFDFEIKIKKNSIRNNTKKLNTVLNLCIKNNIKLIFPSTSSFKYNTKLERVSNKLNIINDYILAKFICEQKIIEFNKLLGLKFFIFRIFNVYGGNLHNRWVVASIIKKLKKKNTLELMHSENYRDFIHIDDLCNLLVKSIRFNINGIFEIGSGKALSLKSLSEIIKNSFEKKKKIIFIKPVKSYSNNYSKAEIKKTKKIFLWKPKISLANGIKKLIKKNIL